MELKLTGNNKISNYLFYQLPWQAMMVAIFIQSSMSQLELPDLGISWVDKIAHFFVFRLLGWLVARGIHHSRNKDRQRKFFKITLIVCLVYAATDEIHQLWIPGRYADIFDFVADMFGIIFFAWLYKKWYNGRAEQIDTKYKIQNDQNSVFEG